MGFALHTSKTLAKSLPLCQHSRNRWLFITCQKCNGTTFITTSTLTTWNIARDHPLGNRIQNPRQRSCYLNSCDIDFQFFILNFDTLSNNGPLRADGWFHSPQSDVEVLSWIWFAIKSVVAVKRANENSFHPTNRV